MLRPGAAAAAVVLGLGLQAAHGETIADALVSAYRNSGLLDQQRALLRAADEDVAQAVATLRPILGYAGRVNYNDPALGDNVTSSASVDLSFLLYDFGDRGLRVDAQKETVLATREVLVGVEQQVFLRAVVAFMNVRRETAFVSLRQSNVRLIEQELRAARDRFEVGEVTRTDVSIAEARLAAARSALAAAEGALARAREEYRAAVGRYPGGLSAPGGLPETAGSLSAATEVARSRHPDIRRAQHEVTVAELNISRTRTNYMPRLNATGSVGVNNNGDQLSALGLSLTGPIYQGGQLASVERQAVARRDAARAGLLTTTIAVDQNVGNAWANLQVAKASLEASDQQIRAADLAFKGVQEEAALGARTTLDVLNAEQELLDARANRISAESDEVIAAYQLLAAMGLLTAEHLNLSVAAYDPAAYYNSVKNAPISRDSERGRRLDSVLRAIGRQ
ncbi:MAG: TolC family outer membrane protein [Rhodobacteraceae bacterium]|nr:TolC family outer membrane protein [Paracoccaceae bacterium]